VQQTQVETLTRKMQKEALQKMSHHMIENHAMHRLQFCDPKSGIHGATPFETVHTIQLGWHVYLNSAFFKQKKTDC